MSYCLDLLLDAARRRECEANDAADREMDMKHGMRSASRAYVDLQARQPLPPAGEFEITAIRFGQPELNYRGEFASSLEAHLDALKKAGPGARVIVNQVGWLEQSIEGAA